MRNACVIDSDISGMHFVGRAPDPEFPSAFDDIDDLAIVVDLRRRVETAFVHDLAGVQQLGRLFEAEAVAFAMRNFDFRHDGLLPNVGYSHYSGSEGEWEEIAGKLRSGEAVHYFAVLRRQEGNIVGSRTYRANFRMGL
ncbi:hypothetical protein D3C74_289590 [compost metagenome]